MALRGPTEPLARLRAGAALLIATAVIGGCDDDGPRAADVVLRNGYVYTVDANDTVAEAVAVRDGSVVFVGRNADADAYVGSGTEVVDLGGRMLMPGLVDGHVHPLSGAAATLKCSLEYLPLTIVQMRAKIETCLDASADEGADAWLEVVNWDRQAMNAVDRDPTRTDLDAIGTDRPIIVSSIDLHTRLLNSRGLAVAGITAATPDPSGGKIARDDKGEPTGILEDGAALLADAALPPLTDADRVGYARIALDLFRRNGVTGFLTALSDENDVKAFSTLSKSGELTARAEFAMVIDPASAAASPVEVVAAAKAVADRYTEALASPTPVVEVRHVKLWADGVLQAPAQTARVLEPYNENIGSDEAPNWVPGTHRGEAYFSQATLDAVSLEAAKAGFDTHLHAIGDETVRMGLNAIEHVRTQLPASAWRPAIAHNELVHPADYARFRSLDVVASMQYQWAQRAPYSVEAVQPQIGPARYERMEPEGSLDQAGARLAYGSDWPVDPMAYFYNLRVGVTRSSDPNHPASFGPAYAGRLNGDPLLSRQTVLRSATLNAAHQLRLEGHTGSIETGKWADLIVLDRNFATAPESEIAFTGVQLTMVGGRIVWADGPFAAAWASASRTPIRGRLHLMNVRTAKSSVHSAGGVTHSH